MPTNRLVEKDTVVTYASVLLRVVNASSGIEGVLEVRDQIDQIVRVVRENIDLAEALSSSSYTPEQRATIANGVFEGANVHLVHALAIMAERGEIGLLARVGRSFEEQLASKLNVTVVDVTTVVELDDHLRDIITKKASGELGTDVVLREHIDPSILGGIRMSANGRFIDASILSQLENARATLKQTEDGGEC